MGRRKDQAQFNMRLSRPLLKQLQNAAKDQDRSLNSEMVHRLEQSFDQSRQDQLARLTERYRLHAKQCLELAQHTNDSEFKLVLLNMAHGWVELAIQRENKVEGNPDTDLGLAPKADTDPGGVINLIDALRQTLRREPTLEELHAARRRALEVESSNEEPELPMPHQPRKIGGKS